MKAPIFVRELTFEEQENLQQALHSKDSFVVRRAQVLRLSARGKIARQIADDLGYTAQTVRNIIHAFNEAGWASLEQKSMGTKSPDRIFDHSKREKLQEIIHTSPQQFGKTRSTWTLNLLAEVSFEYGLTEEQVSHETIRQAIHALGVSWQRAKHWMSSPDEQYELKKNKEIISSG